MEARQLLTGTFSLGAFIPASATYADQAAKLWTPSRQTGGYTQHQTTTTSGPGWTSTQIIDQDMSSTASPNGDWDEHFTGTTTLTTHSITTNPDGSSLTSDLTITSIFDEHRWGTDVYDTSMPGMPPMRMPGPWNYHSSRTEITSSYVETSDNGALDQTQTDSTQTTTQDGTVSASGQDDGLLIFHAHGTTDETYTNSLTDADTGDVQSEDLTTHVHYVFDDTAGRGLSAGTGTMTASGDGYVHDVLTETWGTVSLGTDGYTQTVFTGSDYQFSDSQTAGTETWSITQNANQGQTTETSVSYVTDDGLTVNSTLNASETDTASITDNSGGTGSVQVGETDSLAVHADIMSADGGSTSFDASDGQSLGTNDILGAMVTVTIGSIFVPNNDVFDYLRSTRQRNQPALPMRVIGPNHTTQDIRNTYWSELARQWNGGWYAWPFTGTPGKLGGGSGNFTDPILAQPGPWDKGAKLQPRPKAFTGVELQPVYLTTAPGAIPLPGDIVPHLYVRYQIFKNGRKIDEGYYKPMIP